MTSCLVTIPDSNTVTNVPQSLNQCFTAYLQSGVNYVALTTV